MTRSTVTLGPFTGGLNNAAFATGSAQTHNYNSLADNELVSCKDFDFKSEGTLETRPPAGREAAVGGAFDTLVMNILGFYVDPTTDISYTMAMNGGDLYYRTGSTTLIAASTSAWTLIAAIGGTIAAGIQYADKFYIIRSSTVGGRYWSPALGLNAVASMPAGNSLQVFKERLWATGVESAAATSSRLYYSNVGTGDTWSAPDFVDISFGDGQRLITSFAGPSALYLFKSSSTYVLTYDSLPERGNIQQISASIGILNVDCYTSYEGTLFVVHGESVYQLNGYQYTKVNNKLNFSSTVSTTLFVRVTSLSTMGNRIILQNKYFNYVYYPALGVWAEWTLAYSGKWFLIPDSFRKYGYGIYVSARNSGHPAAISQVTAIQDGTSIAGQPANELPAVYPELKTKLYDFNSSQFKRLHWWGADILINTGVAGNVLAMNLVLNDSSTVATSYTIPNGVSTRKFYKGLKSIRFTRVQFYIVFNAYSFDVGPSSISTIVADISTKESPEHASPS